MAAFFRFLQVSEPEHNKKRKDHEPSQMLQLALEAF
jgi:hypothetical protein